MENIVTYKGIIEFEPPNYTKKHNNQASWKKISMVLIPGDLCDFYAWLLKKRYRILLNPPLRNAHISFINDSMKDLSQDGAKSNEEVEALWEEVKLKWHGKEVDIHLDVDMRTDGSKTWWLNVPEIHREVLQGIRTELGLGRPYFGMHMTIGTVHPKYVNHSEYIHKLIKEGLAN